MAVKNKIDLQNTPLTLETYRKVEQITVPVVDPSTDSSSSDESSSEQETLDEKLVNEKFITPMEYYNKAISNNDMAYAGENEQGYHKIGKKTNTNTQKIVWFWVEDLKNWCSYTVSMEFSGINTFMLNVWNGKNGWIPLFYGNNICFVDSAVDTTGIRFYQNPIINDLLYGDYLTDTERQGKNYKNIIYRNRSINTRIAKDENGKPVETPDHIGDSPELIGNYFNQADRSALETTIAFKLQKNVKYTINNSEGFQTYRWSTNANFVDTDDNFEFKQMDNRNGVTTGVPPLWRLPSGELCLCVFLQWVGVTGNAYCYVKDNSIGPNGYFRKQYIESLGDGETESNRLMGDDPLAAANWINTLCAQFFGDGNNKSIQTDWLRSDKEIFAKNSASNYSYTDTSNMLDSTKTNEQHNINKENDLKCTFVINRPLVTTEEPEQIDYVRKW